MDRRTFGGIVAGAVAGFGASACNPLKGEPTPTATSTPTTWTVEPFSEGGSHGFSMAQIVEGHIVFYGMDLRPTEDDGSYRGNLSFFCRDNIHLQMQIHIRGGPIDLGDGRVEHVPVKFFYKTGLRHQKGQHPSYGPSRELDVEMKQTIDRISSLYLPLVDSRGRQQFNRISRLFRDAEKLGVPVITLVPEDSVDRHYYAHEWKSQDFWKNLEDMQYGCVNHVWGDSDS